LDIYLHKNTFAQLFPVDYFDRYFFIRLVMNAQFNKTCLTFAQRFLEPVWTNVHVIGVRIVGHLSVRYVCHGCGLIRVVV